MTMTDIRDMKELVFEGWKVLVSQGIMDYLGHDSARVPGGAGIVIKPRIDDYQSLTADEMAVADLEANRIEGRCILHSETVLHTSIYRARPDVGGVVHAHPPALNALAACGITFRPVSGAGSILGPGIPVYPEYALINYPEQGAALARTLGTGRVVLMTQHGATTVGPDVKTACVLMVELAKEAKIAALAHSIGSPIPISDEHCEMRARKFTEVERAWSYYTAIANGKLPVTFAL